MSYAPKERLYYRLYNKMLTHYFLYKEKKMRYFFLYKENYL